MKGNLQIKSDYQLIQKKKKKKGPKPTKCVHCIAAFVV